MESKNQLLQQVLNGDVNLTDTLPNMDTVLKEYGEYIKLTWTELGCNQMAGCHRFEVFAHELAISVAILQISFFSPPPNLRVGVGMYGMVWYDMVYGMVVDVCDGYLAAEASRSSFG